MNNNPAKGIFIKVICPVYERAPSIRFYLLPDKAEKYGKQELREVYQFTAP